MLLNPELRRYCWLELTPHRLIAAPVIAGLILALVGASSNNPQEALATAGLVGFAVCALLYGSYLAMSAMPEEVRERTWDFQRMSALTPGELAVGKVFGAPVVGWYAGAWFLAVFLVAGFREQGVDTLLVAGAAVFTTLALHAVAMTLGILAARAGATRNSGALFVFVVIWGSSLPGLWFGDAKLKTITWWGSAPPYLWFMLVSSALFAAWAWLGASRTFAGELRVRQLPWAWPTFCLYLGVWVGGLIEARAGATSNRAAIVMLIFFLASGLGAYLLMLTERTGAMTLARVLRTVRGELDGGLRRVLQSVPLWSVSLVCAWAGALALLLMPWSGRLAEHAPGMLGELAAEGKIMPMALAAMLLRDAGIYCIFALQRFPRRPATATSLYVVLLDGVFPALMSVGGLQTVAFLVFPLGRASAAGALAIFLVQAVIAWSIALWRWSDGQKLDLAA